jgi:large subunit ribosomal protein L15e
MSAYKYMIKSFQAGYKSRSPELKRRIAAWRQEPPVARAAGPTNIGRAHELGYKAKQGVLIARVRVDRGLSKRRKIKAGRKPSKPGMFYAYRKSLQARAEERAARKFSNCEVINSYFVGEDGNYKFFEVILVDRASPSTMRDKTYAGMLAQHGRAYRGLTSTGKRYRGLAEKGFGTSRNRPSVTAGQSRRQQN